jgi:putative endonuclease
MKTWYVYIVQCADGTLYTGISTDVNRRLHEHNHSKKGAKYTKARRPVTLRYVIECYGRSEAAKEEARIKKLSRENKLSLFTSA